DIAAGQFWLYVDGQLAASTNLDVATGGDITNGDGEPDPLLFGAKTRAGTSGQEVFFKGLIDEVRLYQRSLSPTEIENLYAAEGGAPIVAYCPSRLDPLLALASLRRRLLLGIGGLSYGFVLAQGNQCRRARWRFSFHDATRGGRAAILSSAERKLTCQPRPDCPASDQLWAHGFRSSPIRVD
ncbi:MAG: hypothetical protein NT154_41885, partial [Verrucomicrobia bacterium]|nr:hypothetical protein [Verrucomicrobiota bacterium]